MLLWEEKLKYTDKTESKKKDSGDSVKLKADKDGKVELKDKTESSYIGIPIEKNGELTTTNLTYNDIEYVLVEVSKPKTVYYILSSRFIIKAEDPNNTTFEKEYYGD